MILPSSFVLRIEIADQRLCFVLNPELDLRHDFKSDVQQVT
jgi:hypothetical protein